MDNNYKEDLYNYFQEDKKFQERYLNGSLLDEYKNELISTKNFENLNHVGGVVTSSEDEKLKNLLVIN